MAFKILHSSDWHLGKRLYKSERLDEQKLFLNWLLEEIQKQGTDLLLIAGDIFDTPFPPTEALRLYFDFLRRVCDESHCQVVMIAGNHDSGRFLEAPLPFLKEKSIHILGQIPIEKPQDLLLKLKNQSREEIEVFALPFFRNHELQDMASELGIVFQGENIEELFEAYFSKNLPEKNCPRLVVAHHQFGNAESEGSELALSISGIHNIPFTPFQKFFDYVALGHIHRPTVLNQNPPVVYSGSPIPWRFSETGKKFLFALTIEKEKLSFEKQTIPTFRKLLRFNLEQENWKEELLKALENSETGELSSFAEIHMQLKAPSHEISEAVRKILKDKNIELLAYHSELPETKIDTLSLSSWRELTLEDLLETHFKDKYKKEELPQEIKESFKELLALASKEEL